MTEGIPLRWLSRAAVCFQAPAINVRFATKALTELSALGSVIADDCWMDILRQAEESVL